jgi:RNA polymerase-interacting CarD/CdnL/TRCF family regulator
MFKKGEYVSYRSEGICKIVDIRVENFGAMGRDMEYYILSPRTNDKSTFFVPVDNEQLVSMMRTPLTADEIDELISSSLSADVEWISDTKARNNFFREILQTGNRGELIMLVRMVLSQIEEAQKTGQKVYVTDINAMKRALDLLLDEFSMALPLEDTDAVVALIEKAK